MSDDFVAFLAKKMINAKLQANQCPTFQSLVIFEFTYSIFSNFASRSLQFPVVGCNENSYALCLPGLSKITEKAMSEQIYHYFLGMLSSLHSRFRPRQTHNRPFFEKSETWKDCPDISSTVGIIFMHLSKTCNCISLNKLIIKIEAYRFDNNNFLFTFHFLISANIQQRTSLNRQFKIGY